MLRPSSLKLFPASHDSHLSPGMARSHVVLCEKSPLHLLLTLPTQETSPAQKPWKIAELEHTQGLVGSDSEALLSTWEQAGQR